MAENKTRARRVVGIACLVLLVALATGVITGPPASAAGPVTVTDLGSLGSGPSQATALNDSGQVVGWAIGADGNSHAFSWTPGGTMVDLGTFGGATSYAADVNNSGVVVGHAQTADGGMHAFSWTRSGGMVDLGTLGGSSSFATAVSDDGVVVGRSDVAGDSCYHAFVSKPGVPGMTDLGTLGGTLSAASAVKAGNVVGVATTATGAIHGFSWTAGGGMVDVAPAGGISTAVAVNSSGQAVGYQFSNDFSQFHAFSWTAGSGFADLGTVGGTHSFPAAVADSGQVVGWAENAAGSQRAFAWTSGQGMVDLGTLGGASSAANGVNAAGQIVGYSDTAGSQQHAFTMDPGDAQLTDLGTLGGTSSQAVDVNAAGQVAGWGFTASGSAHAAFWAAPPPYERLKALADKLPSAPRPFAEAKARLGEALDPALWNSGGTAVVFRDGTRFFDRVKEAVDRLDKANSSDAAKATAGLWAIADELAAQSVNRASSTSGARANEVNNAQRQLAAARQRWAADHGDCFERLKQAWRSAEAAVH